MALIKCNECGKSVSDKAKICPNCGNPINKTGEVNIYFNNWGGLPLPCRVYNERGQEIASCKRGQTVTITCNSPMVISVKMTGCPGNPKQHIKPGENYRVEMNALGFIYFNKVSATTGDSF